MPISRKWFVPINGILQKNEKNAIDSFKQSTNFSARESTRKYVEGRQILVTIINQLYNARIEVDKILSNIKSLSSDQSRIIHDKKQIVTNYFTSHVVVFSQIRITRLPQKMIALPPNHYERPVTTTLTFNNNNSTYEIQPKQKRKLQSDTLVITNTTK